MWLLWLQSETIQRVIFFVTQSSTTNKHTIVISFDGASHEATHREAHIVWRGTIICREDQEEPNSSETQADHR